MFNTFLFAYLCPMKTFALILIVATILTIAIYLMNKDEIKDIVGDLPTNGNGSADRNLNDIDGFVLHHSVTAQDITPLEIARHHTDGNGWSKIGYHYLVYPDGKAYQVNYLETVSPHTLHQNRHLVAICLIGDFRKDRMTKQAARKVARIINRDKRHLPNLESLSTHRYWKPTKCPSLTYNELLDISARVDLPLHDTLFA